MAKHRADHTLDWAQSGVWVQDRTLYLVPDDQPENAPEITVIDQLGGATKVDRAGFEASHMPVQGATVFKPRYAPIQAFCPGEDLAIDVGDGQIFDVPKGDALLRDAQGNFSIMPRHEFNCRYQFVAAGGESAPF